MDTRYAITDTALTSIAAAIRDKLGVSTQYKPSQMPAAIRSIEGQSGGGESSGSGDYVAATTFNPKTCLQILSIPEGVVNLGNAALNGYTSLKEINFPSTLTTLQGGAISGCTNITVLNFPTALKTIGQSAISNCAALQELHFSSTVPPTLVSSTAISIPTTCAIYVPASSLEAYKTATNWTKFASQIYAEGE